MGSAFKVFKMLGLGFGFLTVSSSPFIGATWERVWGLALGIWVQGLRIQCLVFGVWGYVLGFGVWWFGFESSV